MAQQTGSKRDREYTGYEKARDLARAKTPAQQYCRLAGLALLLAGIAGFIADGTFDTGNGVEGGELLIFEVNGWHNLVHLLSGLLLLAAAPRRASAKTIALLFGLTYGAVAVIGLIDGSDVLGWFPVNAADHVLHIALALTGILAAIASPAPEDELKASTAVGNDSTGRRIDTLDPITSNRDSHGRGGGDAVSGAVRAEPGLRRRD
jgi:hypothetical protein